MNLVETLHQYNQKKISFRYLLRQLINFDEWIIPTQPGSDEPIPSLWKNDDIVWLAVFSSEENFQQKVQQGSNEPNTNFMKVDGRWLFSVLENPISAMVIDPQDSHAIQFDSKMFPKLVQWAMAIKVERILSGEASREKSMSILRNFDGYHIPLIQTEDGNSHIALAPDAQGRKLAALFTAEDTLQAFLQIAKDALGANLIIDVTNGEKIFEYLRDLPLDGVVFNCNGPIAPCAISMQMVNMILSDRDH